MNVLDYQFRDRRFDPSLIRPIGLDFKSSPPPPLMRRYTRGHSFICFEHIWRKIRTQCYFYGTGDKHILSNRVCYFHFLVYFVLPNDLTILTLFVVTAAGHVPCSGLGPRPKKRRGSLSFNTRVRKPRRSKCTVLLL